MSLIMAIMRSVFPCQQNMLSSSLHFCRDLAVYLLREARQQHHGQRRIQLLDAAGKIENIGLADIVHRQYEVEVAARLQQSQSVGRRLDTCERGRVAHVELHIFAVDLRLYVAVLFEYIAVVGAAHEKYLVDTVLHELVGSLVLETQVCVIFHWPKGSGRIILNHITV